MDPMTRAALKCLIHHLGIWKTCRVALSLAWKEWRGEPFKHLPPPQDLKEAESRKQLAPAVLLHQILKTQLPSTHAFQVTQDVIEQSGHAFLGQLFSSKDLQYLQTLDQDQQEAFLRPKLDQVPNVVFHLQFTEDALHFTVQSCRFVELGRQLGVSELIPFFCAVDKQFFGTILPEVRFSRKTTLAQGGESCPFIFQFTDTESHKSVLKSPPEST